MYAHVAILPQTMFILNIRQAAAETKDSLFTFGAGVDKRQCAFRFAFQKLMADLQVWQLLLLLLLHVFSKQKNEAE